ncbi:hypothetical protein [Sphingosinicella humi]|nr:hypothetical protein [Sphingosinicella humi]
MRIEANGEFGWLFRLIAVGVAIAGVAYALTGPRAPPTPSSAAVFGCYVAPASPAILLDAAGMHVRQEGFRTIPFHLERLKTGIALAADAPIRADRTAEGYRFGMNESGMGWFMPFYHIENGRMYGVFEERLLDGFQMLASDGINLNYEPTDAARCA